MPHLIIEYSRNLEEDVDIDGFVAAGHDAMLRSALFDVWAVRTRAQARDHVRIADGDPSYGFVHMLVRVQSGRTPDQLTALAEEVHRAAIAYLEPSFARRKLAVNVEVQEVSPVSVRKRTIGRP